MANAILLLVKPFLLPALGHSHQDQQAGGDGNIGIGHVEAGEMVDAPVEVEHVYHASARQTVHQFSEDAGVQQQLGDRARHAGGKDGAALPDQHGDREAGKERERSFREEGPVDRRTRVRPGDCRRSLVQRRI